MLEFHPSSKHLASKKILITGASDGIGRANAICFAKHGADLLLLGRNKEKLEQVFDEIEEESSGKVTIHPMDFATAGAEDYARLAESLNEHFPVIDGLVHNAAQLGTLCPIEYYPESDWENLIKVNLNSAFYLTKAAMPSLKRSKDARLLLISSSVGRKGRAYWGGYGVSKFALEGLMQTLADELGSTSNIRVNSLNPGGTRTAMRQAAYPAEDPNSQPTPESLMPIYLYLLGPEAAHIHGQALDARHFNPEAANLTIYN